MNVIDLIKICRNVDLSTKIIINVFYGLDRVVSIEYESFMDITNEYSFKEVSTFKLKEYGKRSCLVINVYYIKNNYCIDWR